MSTHVSGFQSGFQSFVRYFVSFCTRQISQQQHKGYVISSLHGNAIDIVLLVFIGNDYEVGTPYPLWVLGCIILIDPSLHGHAFNSLTLRIFSTTTLENLRILRLKS